MFIFAKYTKISFAIHASPFFGMSWFQEVMMFLNYILNRKKISLNIISECNQIPCNQHLLNALLP